MLFSVTLHFLVYEDLVTIPLPRNMEKSSVCRCVVLVLAYLAVTLAILLYLVWPQKPGLSVLSFTPDPVDPIHVEADKAWTNWEVRLKCQNPNRLLPLKAETIKFVFYYKALPQTVVAYGVVNDISVPPGHTSTVDMKMKIPLHSAESGIPNLMSECMSKQIVDVLIDLKAKISVVRSLKIVTSFTLEESLQCGFKKDAL